MWIILHPVNGARFCKDNKWRTFALFGSYNSCVKTYKHKGHAQRKASQIAYRDSTTNRQTYIVFVGKNQSIDASGLIIETIPSTQKGYVSYVKAEPEAYCISKV